MPPFFSLPAELREQIYHNLLIDSHGPIPISSGLTATTTSSIDPKLLKISKNFREEYLSLASKTSHLFVNDDPMGSYISPGLKKPHLPAIFRTAIGKLTINLTCLGFNAGDEILFHEGWIEKLLVQLDVEEIRIHVHLYSVVDLKEYENAILWSGKWIRDGRVKELRVFRTNIRDLKGAFEDGVREEIMFWDEREKGFVRKGNDGDGGDGKEEEEENVWLNTAARIEVDALW